MGDDFPAFESTVSHEEHAAFFEQIAEAFGLHNYRTGPVAVRKTGIGVIFKQFSGAGINCSKNFHPSGIYHRNYEIGLFALHNCLNSKYFKGADTQ